MVPSKKPVQDQGLEECPICSSMDLKARKGMNWVLFKKPDRYNCANCTGSFRMSAEGDKVQFDEVPSPYAYFDEFFKAWVDLKETRLLAESIRDLTPNALGYLTGALRYAWQVRIILGAQGDASPGKMEFSLGWDKPGTKEEIEKVLGDVADFQKQIRAVVDEMTEDMIKILEAGEQSRQRAPKREAALKPYEQTLAGFNEILFALEGVKFSMQSQLETFD